MCNVNFDRVAEKGVVFELMNSWTEINFCLPIKAHNLPFETELRITVCTHCSPTLTASVRH